MQVSRRQAVSVVPTLCNKAKLMGPKHVDMNPSTVHCRNIGSHNIYAKVFVIRVLLRNEQKIQKLLFPCFAVMISLPPQDVCSGFRTIVWYFQSGTRKSLRGVSVSCMEHSSKRVRYTPEGAAACLVQTPMARRETKDGT